LREDRHPVAERAVALPPGRLEEITRVGVDDESLPTPVLAIQVSLDSQTRYAAMLGGGYAPLDAGVSAQLSDGPRKTHVLRNLSGSTMTFDAHGRLSAAADELGQGVTMTYASGKLATVTDDLCERRCR